MASESNIEIVILPSADIYSVIPLLQKLGNYSVSETLIKERLDEMVQQNYECIAVRDGEKVIGTCGLWFQTRHYAGKSVEMDHLIIDDAYRGSGVGKMLADFISGYACQRSCNWIELNSYVHNFKSHKFFYNQGFVAKGYHFVKEL